MKPPCGMKRPPLSFLLSRWSHKRQRDSCFHKVNGYDVVFMPYFLSLLAAAYGHAGQPHAGLEVLAAAHALVEQSGERWSQAELHRLQGELLLRQAVPHATQAAACFQQALALARRQQAKSWELRAAMSLSRPWQRQGKQPKRALCWRPSTAGSPRALTRPISRTPRYCSMS